MNGVYPIGLAHSRVGLWVPTSSKKKEVFDISKYINVEKNKLSVKNYIM